MQGLAGLTAALIIAFYSSWHLTLVVIGCIPLVILAGAYQTRQIKGRAAINKKLLEGAGKVCVCVSVSVCVCACLCVCVRACAHVYNKHYALSSIQ